MDPFVKALATIRKNLQIVKKQKTKFTPLSELKQIETLLNLLKSKLQSFYTILPKMDRRRALFNTESYVLKAVFGAATIDDTNALHKALNKLQLSQKDINHSMSQQVTYINKLDAVTSVNLHEIVNLFSILKDVLIKSDDKFKQITRNILWLNVTMYSHSELFMVIRQLKFAILQLTQQVTNIINAIQCVLLGKLPIKLLDPITLHNILKKVSLHLQDGYKLIVGNKIKNIHLYYELIKAAIFENAHHAKLILEVPLSSNNYRFSLYKVIALPTRIFNDTFVQYMLDFSYFGIDNTQRNYILMTEADVKLCSKNGITMCSANRAVFSTQVVNCKLSLYFQTPDSQSLCQKRLFLHYKTPTMIRHNSV